jgi:hypothetical protein
MPKVANKFETNPHFTRLETESASMNEHNDCTVKALAVAARIPYAEAHQALRKRGRKNKRGFYTHEIVNELRARGFKVRRIELDKFRATFYKKWWGDFKNITLRHFNTFPQAFGNMRLLANVQGHVAMYDGKNGLVDWSQNSARRVHTMYMVIDSDDTSWDEK